MAIFTLNDNRLPSVLLILHDHLPYIEKKCLITIDEWPDYSTYPLGRMIKVLGNVGDPKIENDAILIDFGVNFEQFSNAILSCLPKEGENWSIPEKELLYRNDLRGEEVCSVDPPGCKDIDDALHCKKIDSEICEVGVHIADVSFFVRPETPLD